MLKCNVRKIVGGKCGKRGNFKSYLLHRLKNKSIISFLPHSFNCNVFVQTIEGPIIGHKDKIEENV